MKKNCWEAKSCGREPGGAKTADLGECPAATDSTYDGKNDGKNGGRNCWMVAGTLCGGKIQGTFATKMDNCFACEFFNTVKAEEGPTFQP